MVNPGYAVGQLARAFATSRTHEDAATRARAEAKIEAWNRVLAGLADGSLDVGSRTPAGAPAWVTLEVVRGGFATGALAAGGPLEPHEIARLDRLGSRARDRATLNASYLDDAGLAELRGMLEGGLYRAELPEETALLTVAWLLGQGDRARALDVLDAIAPYLDRLRFYPMPSERPFETRAQVCRQSVGDTIEGLAALRGQPRVERMNEALAIWNPLADRALALVMETVEDGTPYRRIPAGWPDRAAALLAEYTGLRARYPQGKKLDRPGESFFELRRTMAIAARDPSRLAGRDAGLVRQILAGIARKRGTPGSPEHTALRRAQAEHAARPLHKDVRAVAIARLRRFPADGGLVTLDGVLDPVGEGESAQVSPGTPMPPSLEPRVLRSLEAPIETLVERGVLPSPETLAEVVPQLSAFVRSAAFDDPALRRLYGATYVAFRARRTLLLLDLSHQVRLEELPWVAAMEAHRSAGVSAAAQSRETLRTLIELTLDAFPHVIIPNPLLSEIEALAKGAGLDLPLVEEIAADIFQGQFTPKYLRAAKVAARLLAGTVYERYYDARYDRVLALEDAPIVKRSRFWGSPPPQEGSFAALCRQRAGANEGGYSVARNGTILEQEQILTTHNLAVLFSAIDLSRERLVDRARACFSWIVARQSQLREDSYLHVLKNSAYAWRQMLFFLALAEPATHLPFAAWAIAELETAPPELRVRFRPVMNGLVAALSGARVEEGPAMRRFLGWTTERHFLAPASR